MKKKKITKTEFIEKCKGVEIDVISIENKLISDITKDTIERVFYVQFGLCGTLFDYHKGKTFAIMFRSENYSDLFDNIERTLPLLSPPPSD